MQRGQKIPAAGRCNDLHDTRMSTIVRALVKKKALQVATRKTRRSCAPSRGSRRRVRRRTPATRRVRRGPPNTRCYGIVHTHKHTHMSDTSTQCHPGSRPTRIRLVPGYEQPCATVRCKTMIFVCREGVGS